MASRLLNLLLPGRFGNPPYLAWFTSARCNARCGHCFYANRIENPLPGELSTGEAIRFFGQYGSLSYLTLGGGEPTLREDLPEVVGHAARACGLKFLNYISNGFLPDRLADHAERIARAAPGMRATFTISVDGLFAAHDRRRRVDGGFDRLLESVGRLERLKGNYPNLHLSTNTTWMPENRDEIDGIHAFLSDTLRLPHKLILFRDPANWKMPPPGLDIGEYAAKAREIERDTDRRSGTDGGVLQSGRRALDHLRLDALADLASERPRKWSCMAGRSGIVLGETGELLPCEPLGRSYGNVREAGFDAAALLSGDRAKALRKEIAGCRCSWECQLRASLPYQPSLLPRLALAWGKRLFGRG